ncbi:AAA family ATPase [Pseudonocardia sp. ICBG601]|uniref:AAA family ATPase n=1 Tax=Pseudonocardia sp. ICBG601 TaxID=2846759 RepID=UPI0035ABFA21
MLIFTSNRAPRTSRRPWGWASPPAATRSRTTRRMKTKVNDELKKHFRPEFLNRIDDIIVFPTSSTRNRSSRWST